MSPAIHLNARQSAFTDLGDRECSRRESPRARCLCPCTRGCSVEATGGVGCGAAGADRSGGAGWATVAGCGWEGVSGGGSGGAAAAGSRGTLKRIRGRSVVLAEVASATDAPGAPGSPADTGTRACAAGGAVGRPTLPPMLPPSPGRKAGRAAGSGSKIPTRASTCAGGHRKAKKTPCCSRRFQVSVCALDHEKYMSLTRLSGDKVYVRIKLI